MKTKHLFYAAGFAAMMAACTNEEIVLDAPQIPVDGSRATVENVQLYFGAGVDSRLTFDGTDGYAWEATDTIGALLMDSYVPAGSTWETKYPFVPYVNTSYPFVYDAEEGTWGTIGKMLEGNYFFAFPWSSYDGARAVKHSLFNQQQDGVAGKAVAKSFAKNQFFIGYAKIKAGTQATETLEDVEMTDVLGAIQLRMVNNSGKDLHIYKVVLSGKAVKGELSFDPTSASYSYDAETSFNINKYLGVTPYTDVTTMNSANALRAVVKEHAGSNVAQLIINGTDAERAVAKGATGYALIMTAPMSETEFSALDNTDATLNDAKISVFTDEGVFTDAIDLKGAVNVSGTPVKSIEPGVSTTLQVNLQTMSALNSIDVYTEKDLKQLINWNIKANTATQLSATLKTDLVLTQEVFNLLKSNSQLSLSISGDKKITLAKELPANALDYTKLTIATTGGIEVLGTVNLTTSTSVGSNTLTIAEGAAMTVNVNTGGTKEAVLPTVINKGTITIGAVKVADAGKITNEKEGVITIASGADVKAASSTALTNKGTINLNGYMNGVTNGVADLVNDPAVINLGEGATIEVVDNYAAINAAKNSTVSGTNKEVNSIVTVVDTTVDVAVGSTGMVAVEYQGEVAKDAYKNTGINTLILKSGETKFKDATTGGIANVIALNGAKIVAADGVNLVLTSLVVNGAVEISTTVSGESTVLSSVKTANAVVKKGATLTNNGKLQVTGTWSNEGLVVNNEAVELPTDAIVAAPGNWKYKKPTTYVPAKTAKNHDMVLDGTKTIAEYVTAWETANPKNTINVTSVTIKGALDMSKAGNKDNVSTYLAGAVTIDGGSLTNMTDGLMDMTKLIINGNVTISGQTKCVVLKTDELIVNTGSRLTIEKAYIEIDVVAKPLMGCGKITNNGGIVGNIVAKDATNVYQYWDPATETWAWSSAQTVGISNTTVANLSAINTYLATSNNVDKFELSSNVEESNDVELDLNGKTLDLNDYTLKVSGKLTLKNGTILGDNRLHLAGVNKDIVLENVIFKNATTAGVSAICHDDIDGEMGNVTIKNCTFEGFGYDAVQLQNIPSGKTVTVEGNKFVAPTEAQEFNPATPNNNGGSYLHVISIENDGKLIVKNNTFGKADKFVDRIIKIKDVYSYKLVEAGLNTFADDLETLKAGKEIYINKRSTDKICNVGEAYEVFTGTEVKGIAWNVATESNE